MENRCCIDVLTINNETYIQSIENRCLLLFFNKVTSIIDSQPLDLKSIQKGHHYGTLG